jgi:hypothetical protein
MRRPAIVNGLNRKWSHLLADTPGELRSFAARLGLSAAWIQERGTAEEHFDVTDAVRHKAITLGAEEISYFDLGRVTRRIQEARAAAADVRAESA